MFLFIICIDSIVMYVFVKLDHRKIEFCMIHSHLTVVVVVDFPFQCLLGFVQVVMCPIEMHLLMFLRVEVHIPTGLGGLRSRTWLHGCCIEVV